MLISSLTRKLETVETLKSFPNEIAHNSVKVFGLTLVTSYPDPVVASYLAGTEHVEH